MLTGIARLLEKIVLLVRKAFEFRPLGGQICRKLGDLRFVILKVLIGTARFDFEPREAVPNLFKVDLELSADLVEPFGRRCVLYQLRTAALDLRLDPRNGRKHAAMGLVRCSKFALGGLEFGKLLAIFRCKPLKIRRDRFEPYRARFDLAVERRDAVVQGHDLFALIDVFAFGPVA